MRTKKSDKNVKTKKTSHLAAVNRTCYSNGQVKKSGKTID